VCTAEAPGGIEDWNDACWAQQDLDERWIHTQLEREMPKVSEMVQSKYLRKEDIEDDTPATIKGVKLEDLGKEDSKEQRWVIYFKQFAKGMVLNVTTIRVLESAYGDDTDVWVGKQVLLYVDPNVSFQGRVVGGLRLRIPRPKLSPQNEPKPRTVVQQAAAMTDPEDPGFDDNIPF
jgi:hypothetical protein